MIEHVYRRSCQAGLDRVVVLTDDSRIADAVTGFGGEVEMTPEACATGTDRIAFAAGQWDCDAVINIQGDEPLIDPVAIGKIADHLRSTSDVLVTLASAEPVDQPESRSRADVDSPHVVKVVCDLESRALYFSRSTIPFAQGSRNHVLRHIGIYGYRHKTLMQLSALPQTELEITEGLEQLRALSHGIPIRVLMHDAPALGVDTPEDIQRVENYLDENPPNRSLGDFASGDAEPNNV